MPDAAGLSFEHHGGGPSATGRPPLVLIHGAGGTRLYWPPRLRRIDGWDVYAPDLPGHGASPGPGRSTIGGYVEAVRSWMDELGLPPCVVVGHSMGGAIAQALALDAPGRVAALVLVGTGARLRVHPMLLEAARSGELGAEAIAGLMSAWYAPQAAPRLRELAARSLTAADPAVLRGDLEACDAFDVMGRLESLERPALVLVGEVDQMTPVKYAQYLVDRLPGARLEIVPAAGHMVMLERPEAVEAALTRWLSASFPPA